MQVSFQPLMYPMSSHCSTVKEKNGREGGGKREHSQAQEGGVVISAGIQ